MPPGEVVWRMKCLLGDALDRMLVARRQRVLPESALLNGSASGDGPGFRVSDVKVGQWVASPADANEREWSERLLSRADRVVQHRLSFFDLYECDLGDPIDWNRDYKAGKAAPMTFSPSINYREFGVTGDCKFVWEPNRHHQLVVLARAYCTSGDERYAQEVVEQLESWLDQCPFGIGMQWRSPLELGIRLINWVWAIGLIRESDLVKGQFRTRLLNAVYRHLWEVARKYSCGSSVNNHLIGEAAGVYVAASYFRNLKEASRWRADARRRLCEEMLSQTFGDGGGREQAVGYHVFVLQFFLIAGLVGRWTGEEFPAEYWERLEKMFEFLGGLSEGGDHLPMFGDADDGYVLNLGDDPRDPGEWLAVGAVLFERPDFKQWSGRYTETARWLLGGDGRERFDALTRAHLNGALSSRAFPEAGYYLLQCGRGAGRISVVFDCGELGMGALAAHGHADALSFTLRAFGVDVLVDPGTYDYFSYPQWREYFRSARAHNTVVVDGEDQSEMLGAFLWGRRAHTRCIAWEPSEHGGQVRGEHDGYACLPDPVIHRRTLELDGQKRELTIRDEIDTLGKHEVALHLHLAEHCRLDPRGPNSFHVDTGAGAVRIEMDERLTVEVLEGSENPIGGWVSRGYHCKAPAVTLVGRCTVEIPTSLVCRIEVGRPETQ